MQTNVRTWGHIVGILFSTNKLLKQGRKYKIPSYPQLHFPWFQFPVVGQSWSESIIQKIPEITNS